MRKCVFYFLVLGISAVFWSKKCLVFPIVFFLNRYSCQHRNYSHDIIFILLYERNAMGAIFVEQFVEV